MLKWKTEIYVFKLRKCNPPVEIAIKYLWHFSYIYIYSINLVSFKVTLRSSGTDILYGCHLLLDVYIYIYIYIYIYRLVNNQSYKMLDRQKIWGYCKYIRLKSLDNTKCITTVVTNSYCFKMTRFLMGFVLLDLWFRVYVLCIGVCSFPLFLLVIVLSVLLWCTGFHRLFGIFWPLCCLFFFDVRVFIASLVSSNSSYLIIK